MSNYQETKNNTDRPVDNTANPVQKDNSSTPGAGDGASKSNAPQPKRKLSKWIKIPIWILVSILLIVLLIPVLLYVPPIQDAAVKIACDVVRDKTGMDVHIDKFRLKFPLDIDLKGVSVVEATGDTMVMAKEAVVGVKLLPLVHLDVDVEKLKLIDGYYRMVSPDSSMIMKIKAGLLALETPADFNIKSSRLLLDKANLENGDISLYMNVWKQQPTPTDTTATPFYIQANDLKLKNIRFAMSMLPTIDTLVMNANDLTLRGGIIDLATNNITADLLNLDGGGVTYLAPTPEYVAAHPAPVSDSTSTTPPMTIKAKEIGISNLSAIYAIKGMKPVAGFDPNYIEVSKVNIQLKDFYNQATALRLPIQNITAVERSGLQITGGHGLIALDEAGIKINNVALTTPYSIIGATADLPFALMELQPKAPVNAEITASLGMPDIISFMPDLAPMVKPFDQRKLLAEVNAKGALDNVSINKLDILMPGVFSVKGEGYARHALDFKQMVADITLKGEISNPTPINTLLKPNLPVDLPALTLSGRATANNQNYMADIDLRTPQGSLVGKGHVGMTSERYDADLSIKNLNVAHFMPDLQIGHVTASITAQGAGFNPSQKGARTSVKGVINHIDYAGKSLHDIKLDASLADSDFTLDLDSPNQDMNLTAHLTGSLMPDNYCTEGIVKIYNADLKAFGFSDTECYGSVDLRLDVAAQPEKWLYDASLQFSSIDWHLEDSEIYVPDGLDIQFEADPAKVHGTVTARGTDVEFDSDQNLKSVVEGSTKAIDVAMRQIKEQNLDVEEIGRLMPRFNLKARVNGNGLLKDFLSTTGMGVDTLSLNLANDSLIRGDIYAGALNTGSMVLDTLTLNLIERNKMLDYKIHLGNRPGNLDEFAQVNLNGYVGSNRISAFLNQHNIAGKRGYRFGFTGAVQDSTISVHFTPLNATIAYMPWVFNEDNHVDYCFKDRHVNANLKASSRESSILLMTEDNEAGGEDLHLNLTNIHIEDFLNMALSAPPVKGDVDGDIRLNYTGTTLTGKGDIKVSRLIYDKMMVGDLDLGLNAGLDFRGATVLEASLKVNEQPALTLSTDLESTPSGLEPKEIDLELTRFPLSIANPFLGADVAKLSGVLNGKMNMTGSFTAPVLNGAIACDSVAVFLPIMGSSLKFGQDSIAVDDNILKFRNFDIFGANKNPLTINGEVNARKFSDISFDLSARATEFQLINNDRRAKSDLYGKLFLTLTADVFGPMKHFDINANVNVLGNTDVFYTIPMGASQLTSITSSEGVVKFVNFADTAAVQKADTVGQMMAMRIRAGLTITPGAEVTVNLSTNGTDKVQITPSGTLNYFQNYMGDMTLNGQLFIGNGFARYNVPMLGDKTFTFDPASYVLFNGDIMNPTLKINATDLVKASVTNSSGNSSQANFLVGLNVTGTLSSPKVVFDLSSNDDLSLQNELQSMSADQRSTQAMNLLITGRYQGAGMKTTSGPMAESMLYGFLTSTLNQWAAKNIRGVDLSFGVDQYDNTADGQTSTTTSYSYQVSKSLFSNRFKIVVGGNYSTDASADENFAQNLISDISFEYTLKQTNTLSMLVRLFRHVGYESILEGEITETGVGFTMRRRLSNLKRLFKVRWGKKKTPALTLDDPALMPAKKDEEYTDSIKEIRDDMKGGDK